ncbi:MAG: hypothetical protein GX638_14825 [Crenarchaeota archaeon]|nr:hypothetical protein [Thermoproteota archaeon]
MKDLAISILNEISLDDEFRKAREEQSRIDGEIQSLENLRRNLVDRRNEFDLDDRSNRFQLAKQIEDLKSEIRDKKRDYDYAGRILRSYYKF